MREEHLEEASITLYLRRKDLREDVRHISFDDVRLEHVQWPDSDLPECDDILFMEDTGPVKFLKHTPSWLKEGQDIHFLTRPASFIELGVVSKLI